MFKKQIAWKIFRNTMLIYAIVTVLQIVFYLFIFEPYYINKEIETIKAELQPLMNTLETRPESEFTKQLELFTENSGYYTEYINPDQDENLTQTVLSTFTFLDENNQLYTVYIPATISSYHLKEYFYPMSLVDEMELIKHKTEPLYYPITLEFKDGEEFEYDLDRDPLKLSQVFDVREDNILELEGSIQSVDILEHHNQEFNLVLMQEFLKTMDDSNNDQLFQEEVFSFHPYHRGTYSTTSTELGDYLVFINELQHDDGTYQFYTLSALQPIQSIIRVILRFTFISFAVIFIFLMISTYINSRSITKPLRKLTAATKDVAAFQFSKIPSFGTGDEIDQLATSFNTMSSNLENTLTRLKDQNLQLTESLERENENEQLRKDFVAGLSHEMKTPLAVIMASSHAMLDGIFTDTTERNDQLQLIIEEVEKANTLILNMMEIYRLDQPAYVSHFKNFSLDDLIHKVLNELIHLNTKELKVVTSIEDSIVYGDPDKIEIVLSNLLTNAIKYSPQGETIIINTNEINNEVIISVENTGVHLNEEAISKVFHPFYKGNLSTESHMSSSGLGLYLVSLILNQHQSTYSIQNTEQGVCFSLTLKLTESKNMTTK